MAGKAKIKYVQLEPAAFLSDEDFQMMTDSERGIYCTVIFYMFCNHGRLKNDPNAIKRLCNVTSRFEQKWESVMSKLYQKGTWLRHRRVDYELNRATEKMQIAVESGLKGAEKRWGAHKGSCRKPVANENETKRRRIEENTSNSKRASKEPSSSPSNSLRFIEALENYIQPRNQSDRTAFRNLANWLNEKIIVNEFDNEIYIRVLEYAKEATAGRNPSAVLFATLRREIGYRANRKG